MNTLLQALSRHWTLLDPWVLLALLVGLLALHTYGFGATPTEDLPDPS